MPSTEQITSFAVVIAALIAVPGPSVLFIVGRGIAAGRRAALLSVVGNASGIALQLIVVAFGLGTLLTASNAAYTVLRLTGAVVLVLLGLRTMLHAPTDVTTTEAAPATAWRTVRGGLLVGVTNPKGLIIFGGLLPPFIESGHGSVTVQVLVLGVTAIVLGTLVDSTWALASGQAREWFGHSRSRVRRLGVFGGLLMVGLGVHTALSGRRP